MKMTFSQVDRKCRFGLYTAQVGGSNPSAPTTHHPPPTRRRAKPVLRWPVK
jgi:hypothetical protein